MTESMVRPSGGSVARGLVVVLIATAIGVLLLRQDDGAVAVSTADTVAAPGTISSPTTTAAVVDTPADTTTATAEATTETTTAVEGTDDSGTDEAAEVTVPAVAQTVQGFEPRPSNEVRVQVANSTSVSGVAGRTTDDLKTRNYVTLTPANFVGQAEDSSKVYHQPGNLLEAQVVAGLLGLDPQEQVFKIFNDTSAIDPYEEPDVLVIIGLDIAEGPG